MHSLFVVVSKAFGLRLAADRHSAVDRLFHEHPIFIVSYSERTQMALIIMMLYDLIQNKAANQHIAHPLRSSIFLVPCSIFLTSVRQLVPSTLLPFPFTSVGLCPAAFGLPSKVLEVAGPWISFRSTRFT